MSSVAPHSSVSSGPFPLDGGRRRRSVRRGGDGPESAPAVVVGGDEVVPPMGGLRMTRKQRASVKKVAKALKSANKKAHRLAMTLKKKLGRGRR